MTITRNGATQLGQGVIVGVLLLLVGYFVGDSQVRGHAALIAHPVMLERSGNQQKAVEDILVRLDRIESTVNAIKLQTE